VFFGDDMLKHKLLGLRIDAAIQSFVCAANSDTFWHLEPYVFYRCVRCNHDEMELVRFSQSLPHSLSLMNFQRSTDMLNHCFSEPNKLFKCQSPMLERWHSELPKELTVVPLTDVMVPRSLVLKRIVRHPKQNSNPSNDFCWQDRDQTLKI